MVLVVGAVDSSVRLSATSGGVHASDAFGWCSSSSRRPLVMTESSLGALLAAPTPPLLRRILLRSHGDAAMGVSSGLLCGGEGEREGCILKGKEGPCRWAAARWWLHRARAGAQLHAYTLTFRIAVGVEGSEPPNAVYGEVRQLGTRTFFFII